MKLIRPVLALAAPVAVLAGCAEGRLPEDISTHGYAIDHLFWLIMGITGVAFVATETLLVYAVLRFRHREGRQAQHTHGSHLIEMVWTVVPGIILFFLAIYQIPAWTMAKIEEPPDQECEHVRVLGKQFEWAFQYRGPDGRFDTEDDAYTLGDFVIPVGKPIKIHLRSVDVLHSFFLPNLRVKQDLVPGKDITQWFTATKTTAYARAKRALADENWREYDYEVACAELCGLGHQKMRSKLTILSQAEFDAWHKKQSQRSQELERPPAFQEDGWALALTTDDPKRMYRQAGPGEEGFVEKKHEGH